MLTLTPAYGRDYTTAKAVKADWDAEKDFIIQQFGHRYDGKPANKPQLKGERVIIRYNRLMKTVMVKG